LPPFSFPAHPDQEEEKALDRYSQRLCLKMPGIISVAGRRCSIESTSLYPAKDAACSAFLTQA
jgi:hypothetical protein